LIYRNLEISIADFDGSGDIDMVTGYNAEQGTVAMIFSPGIPGREIGTDVSSPCKGTCIDFSNTNSIILAFSQTKTIELMINQLKELKKLYEEEIECQLKP